MTKRLAMTPAVGLFAGLSVVSYGAVSMLLTGVHGTRQAATNPCVSSAPNRPAPTATAGTQLGNRPGTRTASHVSGRAQHPAGMPVLLAHAVRLAPAQTTPLPSTQPSPSASAPALPQPSPQSSAAASTTLPQPAPAQSTTSTQPLTPGGTAQSPSATPTSTSPTPTPTSTATPTPTTTPTKPPLGTLCLKVQALDSVSSVNPHATVGYAVWVWLSSGTNGTAKITLSASPSFVSPTFSVCVPAGRSTCKVGGLNAGQHVEVQAKLKAPGRSHHHVTLTASATSAEASNSASASVTVDINQKKSSHGSSSQNAGDGTTLPPVIGLPNTGGGTYPGLGIQPTGNLGSAFPQVSPSPSASGTTAANHGHSTKAIDLSAGLPLNVRLIGGQVIGLAALAAAVTIAVARLSLRRQPPPPGKDGPGSS